MSKKEYQAEYYKQNREKYLERAKIRRQTRQDLLIRLLEDARPRKCKGCKRFWPPLVMNGADKCLNCKKIDALRAKGLRVKIENPRGDDWED